ncbi:uncharacterized protein CcaverHIS019_0704300 [Cutaneotrichosporon cavernicola]|uniref:Uncharacterized protein n=1 Tax=Cutaneotrichosporon cavernicola TaxID=279322 RepID=A0AA48LA76_9TREE|nr:uncharacterized protein CcaverHIS019_0704300 [Cutaneotrichosporon cavernicola]BEI94849.1 hypothetical protein CcaverHIS019_0704300 [Cutaneotrichosporon cavernicola]
MPLYPTSPAPPASPASVLSHSRKHTLTSLASSRSSLASVLEEPAPEPTSYESTGLLHYPREVILSTGVPAAYPELWGTYTPLAAPRRSRRRRVASWYTPNWGWERLQF